MQMWRSDYLVSKQSWCGRASRCLTSWSAPGNLGKGLWQVSSFSRCADSRGIISYGSRSPSGYSIVNITGCVFRVHRLVALAFLGPPPTQMAWQVHHRDGDPSNNHIKNLEWVTPSQNVLYIFLSSPVQRNFWAFAAQARQVEDVGEQGLDNQHFYHRSSRSSWRKSIYCLQVL